MPSFVDTNILVYAEDKDAGRKHEKARDLVIELWNDRHGVVSVQVLQEFFVTVTRKLRRRLTPARALEIVREYLTWTVVSNTGELLIAGRGDGTQVRRGRQAVVPSRRRTALAGGVC